MNKKILPGWVAAMVLGGGLVGASAASPALELARQLNQAFIEVADEVSPAVVVINVTQKASRPGAMDENNPLFEWLPRQFRQFRQQMPETVPSQGSGVVIREEGYILTNSHVVEGADKIRVRFKNGKEYVAEVRGVDPQSEIAVIKIDAKGLPVAKLGDSAKTRVGEFAIAIGAPFELDYSVTFGHISAKGRSSIIPSYAGGAAMDQDFLQTDASINPGNSGGPLVNINSEVIGINTLIRGLNTGIGFAVPINLAREVADKLIQDGKFTRAWLGVSIVGVKDDKDFQALAEGVGDGVVVREIVANGPAAKSELRPMDVITKVDGQSVSTAAQLKNEIRTKKTGQDVTLDVVRNGKNLKIKIKPEEWPEETQTASRQPAAGGGFTASQLGIRVQALTRDLGEKFGVEKAEGVLIIEVESGSLADKRGVAPGDVITQVNHQPVATPRDFREAIRGADLKKGIMLMLTSKTGTRFVVLKESGD